MGLYYLGSPVSTMVLSLVGRILLFVNEMPRWLNTYMTLEYHMIVV
jgi:hypothetical protein